MIDTTKFYCIISEDIKNKIKKQLDLSAKINLENNEIFYLFSAGSLDGSYAATMNVSVEDTGAKYNLGNVCILSVEGSYHKFSRGYNSHNGYTNLNYILQQVIKYTEIQFDVKLPRFYNWYIQRVDISVAYDLLNQTNVKSYINNLSFMKYPRRKTRFYNNESVYFSGTTTTLKIYNKFLEFKKHDLSRLSKANFDFTDFFEVLSGLIRFECEIKKKKLKDTYRKDNIKVISVKYIDLLEIWRNEFMKLYRINENGFNIVKDNVDVKNRLFGIYTNSKASNLYGFFLAIVNEGYDNILLQTSKATFYRKVSELKSAGIDFTQNAFIVPDIEVTSRFVDFNPFDKNSKYKEVV